MRDTTRLWGLMTLLFLIAYIPISNTPNQAEARDNMNGVYVLPTGGKGIDSVAAGANFVTGYSIRLTWKVLEPERGKYNWQPIDEIIGLARKNGKFVTLRILAGIYSPKWVMNDPNIPKLELISRNPNKKEYFNKSVRLPRPWDRNYLKRYYSFLEALTKQYAREPLLYWVAVSGPVMGPATPHLPTHPESIKAMERQGFTEERWHQVWEDAIDRTAQAFPNKSISLCIDVPPFLLQLADELAAYAVGKYGNRICLQSNGLSAKVLPAAERNTEVKRFLDTFRKYTDKATIGFQMTWAAAWKDRGRDRLGPLNEAIDAGLQLGASYLEIYQDDIIDSANIAILADASQRLGAAAGIDSKTETAAPLSDSKPSVGESGRINLRDILLQLNLTREQKQKAKAIRQWASRQKSVSQDPREVRHKLIDRIREILTEEQRQHFDELLKVSH